jgi:hypothetical protein
MGNFDHVDVEIVVGKNSASDGCDADGSVANAERIDRFRNDSVKNSMTASGTIAEWFIF